MKLKLLSFFIISLGLLSFKIDIAEKAAQIKFEKTTHDFGKLKQDAPAEFEFVFKNIGDAPLILTNVASTCGCTVPTWPKEPILPGKEGKIFVKYDSHRLGTFSKTITVESNAKSGPVYLTIKGEVL